MTPEPAPKPAQVRLDAIRARRALAAPVYGLVADGDGFRIVAGDGETGATVAIVSHDAPFDDREFFLHLVDDFDWILRKFDSASAERRHLAARLAAYEQDGTEEAARSLKKSHARNAAILLKGDAFPLFLHQFHGLEPPLTFERADARLKNILRIGSKTELDADPARTAAWLHFLDTFDQWRKQSAQGARR